jgi:hypothetical protein
VRERGAAGFYLSAFFEETESGGFDSSIVRFSSSSMRSVELSRFRVMTL